MSLRQQTLVQSLPNNTNQHKGGNSTRTRGPKKEIEQVTPITEFVKGKETRRKKLNGRDTKLEDYYDISGNDKTMISSNLDHSHERDYNQCSTSSVSTNATLDYERINQLKAIKQTSEFTQIPSGNSITIGGNSNIMQVEDKPIQIDINNQKKQVINFIDLLDENQKEKLQKQEEQKAQIVEQEEKKKKALMNFQAIKKNLSSNTRDTIAKILNKNTDSKLQAGIGNTLKPFNTLSSAKKIEAIEERMLTSLKVESYTEQDIKMAPQAQTFSNKMIDEKEEVEEIQTQKLEEKLEIKEQEKVTVQIQNENKFEQLFQAQQNSERVSQIMAGPSLKQKYEDLLNQNQFILPYKYKLLLSAFEKFDECISYFKDRNKPTLFNELKFNMEQTMRSTITLKNLQQILFLYPQAFQIKWIKSEHAYEKWDLSVNSASDENEKREVPTKADRIEKLRSLLVEKIKYYHRLYLQSSGREHLEQELLENFKWHEDFKLQEVPQIEEQPLPLKPFEIKVEPLKETLQKNTVKNDILARIMQSKAEELEEKERKKKELIEKSLYISTKDNKTGLSDRLYQLIKAKEEKLNEEKIRQSLSKPSQMQGRIPEIKKVVEIMVVYFIQRKVSNMFYVSVVDYLVASNNIIISKAGAIEILDHLIQTCPFWITLIPNKQGNIIRIDKSIPISKILVEVEKSQL